MRTAAKYLVKTEDLFDDPLTERLGDMEDLIMMTVLYVHTHDDITEACTVEYVPSSAANRH